MFKHSDGVYFKRHKEAPGAIDFEVWKNPANIFY